LQTFLGDKAYKGELAIITPDKKAKNRNGFTDPSK